MLRHVGPGMRFVPIKSEEQQGMLTVHRARDLLVRQRTAAVNALRGHLGEFGIIAAKGVSKARELMSLVGVDERVPAIARDALLQLVEQIRDTERKIEVFDKQILSLARQNEVCRRLMTVLTIGPFTATALAATVGNPRHFTSGRHFAAWVGLVPKQHSTGGKEKLGGISKRGDAYLRKLLIHGARAARTPGSQSPGAWSMDRRVARAPSFQHRHRRSRKQDSAHCVGGDGQRLELPRSGIAPAAPNFRQCEGDQGCDDHRSDRDRPNPMDLSGLTCPPT
jgi:transposase